MSERRPHPSAAAWFDWPARAPVRTLLAAALLLASAAVLAGRLRVHSSIATLFRSDNPAAAAMVDVTQHFRGADDLILVARVPEGAEPDDPQAALRDFAFALRDSLAAQPESDRYIARVSLGLDDDARAFVEQRLIPSGVYYLDAVGLASLRERLSREGMTAQLDQAEARLAAPGPAADALARELLRDPLSLRDIMAPTLARLAPGEAAHTSDGLVLSTDGRAILIRIGGYAPATDLDFTRGLLQHVRDAARDAAAQAQNTHGVMVRVEYTGGYAIAAHSERAIRMDMIVSITATVVLLQLLFFLMYRSVLSFPVTLLPVACAILAAFGAFALWRGGLTPLTAVAGGLLAGLGIDYAIHFVSHYAAYRDSGATPLTAVGHTAVSVAPGVLGACLTSIIGFGAIYFAGIDALIDFAVLGAIGLAASLIATFTVLPALLALLERSRVRHGQSLMHTRVSLEPQLIRIGRHATWLIAVMGVLAAASGALLVDRGFVRFEDSLRVMHPQPNPPLDALERVAERFGGGADSLTVLIEADSDDGLLRRAHEASRSLESDDVQAAGVSFVSSIADWLPDPARVGATDAALIEADRAHVLDDFDAAVAASAFNPAAFAEYRDGLDRWLTPHDPPTLADLRDAPALASHYLPDEQPSDRSLTLMTVFFDRSLSTHASRESAVRAMRSALADVPGATVTGIPVLGHDTETDIRRLVGRLAGIAACVVAFWLLLCFRDPRDAALCLVPVAFAMVCLLALMHLTGEKLNMINLIAMPLLLGVGVDDGIFLVNAYRRWRHEPAPIGSLVAEMAASSHAIVMTSLTTSLAFGSLIFTGLPAMQSLGRMMALGVLLAVAGSLLLLAPIIIRLAMRNSAAREA